MSLNTRRVKKMLVLMHCLVVILCFHKLDFIIFGLETIKDQYVHDADFKDVMQNCKEGRMWNNDRGGGVPSFNEMMDFRFGGSRL